MAKRKIDWNTVEDKSQKTTGRRIDWNTVEDKQQRAQDLEYQGYVRRRDIAMKQKQQRDAAYSSKSEPIPSQADRDMEDLAYYEKWATEAAKYGDPNAYKVTAERYGQTLDRMTRQAARDAMSYGKMVTEARLKNPSPFYAEEKSEDELRRERAEAGRQQRTFESRAGSALEELQQYRKVTGSAYDMAQTGDSLYDESAPGYAEAKAKYDALIADRDKYAQEYAQYTAALEQQKANRLSAMETKAQSDPYAVRVREAGRQRFEQDNDGKPWLPDFLGTNRLTRDTVRQHLNDEGYAAWSAQLKNDVLDTGKMEESDKDTFYYLYATDPEAAMEWIENRKNERQQEYYAGISESAGKDRASRENAFFGGVLASIGSGLLYGADVDKGYASELAHVGQALTGGGAKGLEEHGIMNTGALAGTLPEEIPIIGGKGLGAFYELGTSMLQSAAVMPLGPEGAMILGYAAAASDYAEMRDQGYSDTEARLHSACAGLAESIFEYVSLDHLINEDVTRGFIRNVLTQAGVEASEEINTTIANTITDEAILGSRSKRSRRVQELMANGMSYQDAQHKADAEWLSDMLYDGLAGAASGGIMSGSSLGYRNLLTRATVSEIRSEMNRTVGTLAAKDTELLRDIEKYAAENKLGKVDAEALRQTQEQEAPAENNGRQGAVPVEEAKSAEKAAEASVDTLQEETKEAPKNKKEQRQQEREEKKTAKRTAKAAESVGKVGQQVAEHIEQRLEGKTVSQNAETIAELKQQYPGLASTVDAVARKQSAALYSKADTLSGLETAHKDNIKGVTDRSLLQAVNDAYKYNVSRLAKSGDQRAKAISRAEWSIRNGALELAATYKTADGAEAKANITGISKDGKHVVLDNGDTVRVDALDLDADTRDILGKLTSYGLGAYADRVFRAYQLSVDRGDITSGYGFLSEFLTAMDYGRTGVATVTQAINRSNLSEATVREAYSIGEEMSKEVKGEQEKIESQKQAAIRAREADKATESGREGRIDSSRLRGAKVSKDAQAQINLWSEVTKRLGIETVLFSSELDDDGSYKGMNGKYENGKLWIDVNAGKNALGDLSGFLRTVAHELTHFGRVYSPAQYEDLKRFAFAVLGSARGIDSFDYYVQQKLNRDTTGKLTRVDAEEEVIADACETMLRNSDVVRQALERDYGPVRRVIRKIGRFLERFAKLVGRASYDEARALEESADNMKQLQAQWDKMILDAAETHSIIGDIEGAEKHSVKSIFEASGFDVEMDGGRVIAYDKNGNRVGKVTSAQVRSSGYGTLISYAANVSHSISKAEANVQIDGFRDLLNMMLSAQDGEMVWQFAGAAMFSAVRSNSDGQYGTTIDFSTVCRKTVEMMDAMSKAMVELGRGLTKTEVTQLQKKILGEGGTVPCPVCYVFSRWAGVGQILDNIRTFQERYGHEYDDAEKLNDRIQWLERNKKKADLRKALLSEEGGDVAYQNLAREVETLEAENKQLKQSKKSIRGQKYSDAADILAQIDRRISSNEAVIRGDKEQMKKIEAEGTPELAWLKRVRAVETAKKSGQYMPNPDYWTKGFVGDAKTAKTDIRALYDLTTADEFAAKYPLAWGYRTTRGPSAGKAILPYSEMRLGDLILGPGKNSANGVETFKRIENGELNKEQQKKFEDARARTLAQNLIGGQRFQSTSDFRYDYGLDYLQAFLELQALGGNLQTYTKIVEFADMVASMGGDVNMSVIPINSGLDKDGNLIYSRVTGMDPEAAMKIAHAYDSAQLILVGINDAHINAALDDFGGHGGNEIGFVIPYHASGASVNEFIRALVSNLNEDFKLQYYKDYSKVQTDSAKKIAGANNDAVKAWIDAMMRDPSNPQFKGKKPTAKQRAELDRAFRREIRDAILKRTVAKDLRVGNETQEEAAGRFLRSAEDYIRGENKDISGMSFDELRDIEKLALDGNADAIREYESWSAGVLADLYIKMWIDESSDATYRVKLTSAQAAAIMPHEYWNTQADRAHAYINGFIFRSYCYSLGLNPRFTGITSDGSNLGYGDFSGNPGYWKTLIDRAMYDNQGSYRAQQAINATAISKEVLTPAYGKEHFGEYKVREPSSAVARRAAEAFVEEQKKKDGAKYSLRDVAPVEPSSEKWERSATFDEVKRKHPTLFALDADESDTRNPTQVKVTVSTYRKIYNMLKAEGFDGTILDASSGLGLGTEAGRNEYGFDVDDIEPFPDKSYKPRYTDYSTLDKKYDVIISNAVLNVIPQDIRDAMVVKIGEMLNPGGRAFINVRGDDVKNANSKVAIDEDNMEYFISSTGSYQKGFTKNELKAYLEDALGDGFTVTLRSDFGKVSAVVTKDSNQSAQLSERESASDEDYLAAVKRGDMETAQRMVDEAAETAMRDSKVRVDEDKELDEYSGKLVKVFHATDSDFTVFLKEKLGENTDKWASDKLFAATSHMGFYFNTQDLSGRAGNKTISAYLNAKKLYHAGTLEGLALFIADHSNVDPGDDFDYAGHTAKEIAEGAYDYLVSRGYDGIVFEDEEFGGYSFAVFNPEQIKSADPVTYDINGDPIPLSERFNEKNDDIRYSERDNDMKSDYELALEADPMTYDGVGPYQFGEEQRRILEETQKKIKEVQRKQSELRKLRREASEMTGGALEEQQRKIQNKLDQVNRLNKSIEKALNTAHMQNLLTAQRAAQRDITQGQYRNRRSIGEMKARIASLRKDLVNRVLKPTDRRYVPAELATSLVDVLDALDMSPREGTKAAAKYATVSDALRKMADRYKELASNEDYAFKSEYDETFDAALKELYTTLDGKKVKDLTASELQHVYDVVKVIRDTIRDAGKLHNQELNQTVWQAAESVMLQQLALEKQGVPNRLRQMIDKNRVNTMRVVEILSGFDRDAALYKLMSAIEDGADKANGWTIAYDKMFNGLKTGKNEQTYRDSLRKRIDYGFKAVTEGGEPTDKSVPITKQQAIQLIMTYDRESANDNLDHFRKGGVEFMLDEGKPGRPVRERVMPTDEQIAEVRESLTEWDLEWMRAMRSYLQTEARETNKVLYALKHRVLDTEASYIPFIVDKKYLDAKITEDNYDRLFTKGFGATEALKQHAPQPIIIDGLEQMMRKHVSDAANYIGLALPIKDFAKVYNSKFKISDDLSPTTVARAIDRNFPGGSAESTILKTLAEVQGVRSGNTWRTEVGDYLNKLQGAFVKSALLINPSVTIKQAASYYAAYSILSQTALTAGNRPTGFSADESHSPTMIAYLFANPRSKTAQRLFDEIDEHTAEHAMRRKGMDYSEMGTKALDEGAIGRAAGRIGAKMEQNAVGRATRKALSIANPINWIQRMDVATTAALWIACKEQAKLNGYEVGSKEYWDETTYLYKRCLRETQPMYDPLHRAGVQKSEGLLKYLFPFRTVPIQNHGQIALAYEAYRNATQANKAAAKRHLAKTLWAQAGSAAIFAMMTAIAAGLKRKTAKYRNDDDELTIQSILAGLGSDYLSTWASNIFPLAGSDLMEAGKTGWNLATGKSQRIYDTVSVGVVDLINNLATSVYNTLGESGKLISGETDDPEKLYGKLEALGLNLATAFGIPAKTMKSYLNGAIGNVNDIIEGRLPAWNNVSYEGDGSGSEYDPLRKAIDKNKDLNDVRSDLKSAGKKDSQIDSAISQYLNKLYREDKINEEQYANYLARYLKIVKKDKVNKRINDGKCYREFGVTPSDANTAYRDGDLTRAQMTSLLTKYSSMTQEEAAHRIEALDYTMENPELDWTVDTAESYMYKTPKNDDNSKAKYPSKYLAPAKDVGITAEMYDNYLAAMKDLEYEHGKNGAKKDAALKAIDELPLTPYQKNWLYALNGWSWSDVSEAPWN